MTTSTLEATPPPPLQILMVTPHLPPHQAANALLPHLLGGRLREYGHGVRFLTFGPGEPREGVAYVRRRRSLRWTRVPQALEAAETLWRGGGLLRGTDVVHLHSNTWMNQVAARLAASRRVPYVLTHYGTEVWHYDGEDRAFQRLHSGARRTTFYSQALLEKASLLGLPLSGASVVYPPVGDLFRPLPPAEREAVRGRLVGPGGVLLLNVKRLHPLADHETLLEAMAIAVRSRPDLRLAIAGTGEREGALKERSKALGLDKVVSFLGLRPNEEIAQLQGAADLFCLSSLLEATPTVALEALACGTPVVSTDNPGGLELQKIFEGDVDVVSKADPRALAEGVLRGISPPRRARAASLATVDRLFRLEGVSRTYERLYREALGS